LILYNDLDNTTLWLYSTVFRTTDKSGNISNEFTLIVEVIASLSTLKLDVLNPVNIYPNPTSGNITIQMMSGEIIDEINIYTLHGEDLTHYIIHKSKGVLNLSIYKPGTYFLTIFSNGHLSNRRIVLQ
jgi:hypothetical protein